MYAVVEIYCTYMFFFTITWFGSYFINSADFSHFYYKMMSAELVMYYNREVEVKTKLCLMFSRDYKLPI